MDTGVWFALSLPWHWHPSRALCRVPPTPVTLPRPVFPEGLSSPPASPPGPSSPSAPALACPDLDLRQEVDGLREGHQAVLVQDEFPQLRAPVRTEPRPQGRDRRGVGEAGKPRVLEMGSRVAQLVKTAAGLKRPGTAGEAEAAGTRVSSQLSDWEGRTVTSTEQHFSERPSAEIKAPGYEPQDTKTRILSSHWLGSHRGALSSLQVLRRPRR